MFWCGARAGREFTIGTHRIELIAAKNCDLRGNRRFSFGVDGNTVEISISRLEQRQQPVRMAAGLPSEYASLVLGQVEQMLVRPSEVVKRGQLLCRISSSKMDLQVVAREDGRVGFALGEGQRVVPGALVVTVE